jgi:hypothetical protein
MDYSARSKSLLSILVIAAVVGICSESFGYGTLTGTGKVLEVQGDLIGGSGGSGNRRSSATGKRGQVSNVNFAMGVNKAYTKLAETLNAHRTLQKNRWRQISHCSVYPKKLFIA